MKTPNKLSLIFYNCRNNSLGTCSILFQASVLLYLPTAGRVPKKESERFMEVHSKPWLFPPAARHVTSWFQQVGIIALPCLAHETGERITGHTGWAGLFPTQLSGTLSQVPQLLCFYLIFLNATVGEASPFSQCQEVDDAIKATWKAREGGMSLIPTVFLWPPAKPPFVLERPILINMDCQQLDTARANHPTDGSTLYALVKGQYGNTSCCCFFSFFSPPPPFPS